MISRDWMCLNPRCRKQFHSYEKASPPCPVCGCLRCDWVPGGGHMLARSPGIDADLRRISDQHGGMNLNSVSNSRINRAAPILNKPGPPPDPEYGIRSYGTVGMSAPLSRRYDPHGDIYCVQTGSQVAGKVGIGSITRNPRTGETYNAAMARTGNSSYDPAVNAVVHYKHKP